MAAAQKIVICGSGFLGSYVAKELIKSRVAQESRRVVLTSRNTQKLDKLVQRLQPSGGPTPLSSAQVDIQNTSQLGQVFKDASLVVSLVGILRGSKADFENLQWHGARNVAVAAQEAGAKLVHISAIGADPDSPLDYPRTKGLGERDILKAHPSATIIRPSLVFGPGDEFFARFAKMSQIMPFLPVFGLGGTRFQPVYAADVARIIEAIAGGDENLLNEVRGKVIEAGGPDVFTYKELMNIVLKYSNRWRPILPLPYTVGQVQGAIMEKLPPTIFSITRDQVSQLESDNIETKDPKYLSLGNLLNKYGGGPPKSVHDILPTYIPAEKNLINIF
ncbi:NAD(P)-binding protein [Sistotremastrum suecicum HHB10207 ss-3]|uniref:NAD(P)-binding protein n=1 Tax=Sistotremastrum suecicum HHB10207 ss-3 TaxID=1314776 RepID=A0A166G844_9AGAM|nr:NAD(P)-binding protein [Sistotremastrum suecicum HHB10207 ss-3]